MNVLIITLAVINIALAVFCIGMYHEIGCINADYEALSQAASDTFALMDAKFLKVNTIDKSQDEILAKTTQVIEGLTEAVEKIRRDEADIRRYYINYTTKGEE